MNALSNVQFSFRQQKLSPKFVPSGGTQTSFRVQADLFVRPDVELALGFAQERWMIPVLDSTPQQVPQGWVELKFWPYRSASAKQ